jgi:hypothetical protein
MQLPNSDELAEPRQLIVNPNGAVQVLVSTPTDEPDDYECWEATCLAPTCDWTFSRGRIGLWPVVGHAIHHTHYDH